MYGNPYYSYSSPSYAYNPYAQSAYQRPSYFEQIQQQQQRDRARALAEQRARRAQWLPDEVGDDDWEYGSMDPRERAFLEAQRKQEIMERARLQEVLRAREREEAVRRLQQRAQEEEEARRRLFEERQRRVQQEREAQAHRMAAAFENGQQRRAQSQARATPRAPSQCRQEPQTSAQQQRTHAPSPSRPSPPNSKPETPKPVYTEDHANAASVIQQRYRVHHSHRVLDNIKSKFKTLQKDFTYPSLIDFQQPGSEDAHITIHATRPPSDFENIEEDSGSDDETMEVDNGQSAKLAYTAVNYRLHNYTDALDKLLMKLDGVDSWGKKEIRLKRKAIVQEIARESAKLDRYWKQAWVDHVEKQKGGVAQQDAPLSASEQEPVSENVEVEAEQHASSSSPASVPMEEEVQKEAENQSAPLNSSVEVADVHDQATVPSKEVVEVEMSEEPQQALSLSPESSPIQEPSNVDVEMRAEEEETHPVDAAPHPEHDQDAKEADEEVHTVQVPHTTSQSTASHVTDDDSSSSDAEWAMV